MNKCSHFLQILRVSVCAASMTPRYGQSRIRMPLEIRISYIDRVAAFWVAELRPNRGGGRRRNTAPFKSPGFGQKSLLNVYIL